jgi:predicted dehydrogenase
VAATEPSSVRSTRSLPADWFISPERSYDTFGDMARSEAERPDGIDAVAVVTPNNTHHAICRAFLDNGIAVVCDKPMTTTVADALDLVHHVRTTGMIFVLAHTYSGFPMVRQARAMVESGELGVIRLVHVEFMQDWLAARSNGRETSRPVGAQILRLPARAVALPISGPMHCTLPAM